MRPGFFLASPCSAEGLPMTDISIALDYLGRLLAKIRAVQGKEGEIISDPGSNAIDDDMTDALQDHPADPSRQEIRDEIRGLNDRQQAELVALVWLGRGDAEPEDWEATVELARERRNTPVARYLLAEPLVAEYLVEGLDKLGLSVPVAEVEERRGN
jgi:hypothetical protein